MEELSVAVAVPIVVGLTEIIKKTGLVPDRFNPIIALFFGVLSGFAIYQYDTYSAILSGVVIGLSASGLYRGTEVVINNK